MLVPFKDDNPKSTENTGFQAGSDSTPMASHWITIPIRVCNLLHTLIFCGIIILLMISTHLEVCYENSRWIIFKKNCR